MKTLVLTFLASFALGAAAATPVSQETWTCKRGAEVVIEATFTKATTEARLNADQIENGHAPLSFTSHTQKTALNGSPRTLLSGESVSYDSYYYKVTLIRSHQEDFLEANGRIAYGKAQIETTADLDCYGRTYDSETLSCEVELK